MNERKIVPGREIHVSNESFQQALVEMYQGEIFGEVLFDKMLTFFESPHEKYKIAVMLQLETETKARLRPALMQLGIDVAESEESRRIGLETATNLEGKNWSDTMYSLGELVEPYIDRYGHIAAEAPAEFRPLAEAMVKHEQLLLDFLQCEVSGSGSHALDRIIDQLEHKPPSLSFFSGLHFQSVNDT